MTLHPGYSFDAAALLGIGTPSTEPLPVAAPGEIILRIPDGLTLETLRDSDVGEQLMHDKYWYENYQWNKDALPAGIYLLHVPVPNSNWKTAGEQVAMLPAGEMLASVALVAAALLCIRSQGGPDPLKDDWCRCFEQATDGYRVALAWIGGRLYVNYYWVGERFGSFWASSVRRISN